MSDLAVSLLVVLLACLAAVIVFFVSADRRKKRDAALADYCQSKGYDLSHERGPLKEALLIKGPGFTLDAARESRSNEDRWHRHTLLTCQRALGGEPFVLGSVPNVGGMAALSGPSAEHMLAPLRRLYGVPATGAYACLKAPDGRGFVAFADQKQGAGAALFRLEPLLKAWPGDVRLVIRAKETHAEIELNDCFPEDVRALARLEEIRQAL